MSGSVLIARRPRFRGLALPATEWPLVQPFIDRLNATFAEGQAAAAAALEAGALSPEQYASISDWGEHHAADGLFVSGEYWAWPEEFIAEITTRGDAARHLRDDPDLLGFAEAMAVRSEQSLAAFRASLSGGASSYRNRMILATLAATGAAVIIVGGLAAWSNRRKS